MCWKFLRKYIIMGGGSSLFIIISTVLRKNVFGDTLNTIVFSISSGIFCSAIVSMIIDINNQRDIREKNIKNRKILFSLLRNDVKSLIFNELLFLSEYTLLLDYQKGRIETVDFTVKNAIDMIKELLEKSNCKEVACTYNIDSKYLTNIKKGNCLAFEKSLFFYNQIDKDIENLLSFCYVYVINDAINEHHIEKIKNLQKLIKNIICYSNEEQIELLLSYKLILFTELNEILICLEIDDDSVEKYNIVEENC